MIKYCFLSASYMAGNRSKSYPFFPSSISKPYPLLKRTTNEQQTDNERTRARVDPFLSPPHAEACRCKSTYYLGTLVGLEREIGCNLEF